MSNLVVVGAQWGDEGKGKIVDLLTEYFDVVARYNGGRNAGHTVAFDLDGKAQEYILHLIPSGILHPDKINVFGNGCVASLPSLCEEMKALEKAGIDLSKLYISSSAHVSFDYHSAREREKGSTGKIDTTGRAIGPTYETKVGKTGIRFGDFFRSRRDLQNLMRDAADELGIRIDPKKLVEEQLGYFEYVKDHVTDTTLLLHDLMNSGKKVLFEGAQGTLLDVDFGTYPYVTGSNATAGGAATGTGIPPKKLGPVIGVLKAIITRVGHGPMPTELGREEWIKDESKEPDFDFDALIEKVLHGVCSEYELGRYLRIVGKEYGATTGRERRTGWLDLVLARYANMINGFDALAITKLDMLNYLNYIFASGAYAKAGKTETRTLPIDLENWRPVYRRFHGWKDDISKINYLDGLPGNTRAYLDFISDYLKTPEAIISVGPKRDQTITSKLLKKLLP